MCFFFAGSSWRLLGGLFLDVVLKRKRRLIKYIINLKGITQVGESIVNNLRELMSDQAHDPSIKQRVPKEESFRTTPLPRRPPSKRQATGSSLKSKREVYFCEYFKILI